MRDPGLDRHEWESEWQALEPLVVDAPAEALPELDDLVGRMLAGRAYPRDGEATEEGTEPEVQAGFRAAHDVAGRVERGEDVDPAEIAQAVGLYRELYEHLLRRQADSG